MRCRVGSEWDARGCTLELVAITGKRYLPAHVLVAADTIDVAHAVQACGHSAFLALPTNHIRDRVEEIGLCR